MAIIIMHHGHGHVRVYTRLRHIKRTMHGPELPSDWPSMAQLARLQYSAAGWAFGVSSRWPVAQCGIQKWTRMVMASMIMVGS